MKVEIWRRRRELGQLRGTREKEIKKLDWETEADERKERVRLLKKKRENLEGEVKLINDYIEKYREEEEQEKGKRTESDDDDDDDDDRRLKKWKPVSISLKLYQTLLNYIEHIFFSL